MAYYVNQYPKLETIFDDGRIELDNNLIENAIRSMAIGRKNYLFCGSHKAAQNAAMLYSFFGSCKMQNINPREWLEDTLQRIPDTAYKNLMNSCLDIKKKLQRSCSDAYISELTGFFVTFGEILIKYLHESTERDVAFSLLELQSDLIKQFIYCCGLKRGPVLLV